MTAENLWERVRRRPFIPFRVHLSGGTFFDILHPEMMLIAKTGVTIAIYDAPRPNEDVLPEQQVLVSLLHITSAEDLHPQAKAAG